MEASDGWRSLHPASVLVNLIPTAYRALRSLWPLVVALVIGGARREVAVLDLALLLALLALPVARTVIHWATLRYRIEDGKLVIRTGLLHRQVRTIPPERIQNVEMVRNVFHRMSGLVELRVETASGSDIEGLLSALSVEEAERLMRALDAARGTARTSAERPPDVLVTNGPVDLLRYGLSSPRLGLAMVGLGLVYELLLADTARLHTIGATLGWAGAVLLLSLLLLGAWFAGAALALTRHWGYHLLQEEDRLVAVEGLFTRRRVELPLSKVQRVAVREPLVRRLLGFGSVLVETAAAREQGDGTYRAEAVVPVVERDAIGAVVRRALPAGPSTLHALPFRPPHPHALLRAWIGDLIRGSTLALFASAFAYPYGMIAWMLVPMEMVGTWLDHRHQGWWLGPGHVVSRTGWWVRTTTLIALEKLQSVEVRQGPLARRWGLATLHLRAAGSELRLPILAWEEALALEDELVRRAVELLTRPTEVEHRQDAPREEDPRHLLGDAQGEQQGVEEDRPRPDPAAVIAPSRTHREQADPHDERPHQPERPGKRGARTVEAHLPRRVDPRLEHHGEALEDEEHPEGDLHASDEDPQP